jgi:protein-disulfide isomerase
MEHGSSQMKPSLLFTLVVGLSLGFVIGKVVTTPPAPPTSPAGKSTQTQARFDEPTLYKVTLDDAPARGSASAPVTIVEFSDFQCPYCGRAYQSVNTIEKEYGSKVRLVMKQYPLGFHEHAKPAALAALAAGEQGKFWEMYDLLFTHNTKLDAASLEDYARQAGLDVAKWKADMADPKLAAQIDREQAQGNKLGVSGTPAFFINGRKMVGAQPVDQFRANVEAELARAQDELRAGVRPENLYENLIAKGVERAPAQPQQPSRAPQGPVVKKIEIPDEVPSFGPKLAKVTVVEWSDFQCPFCGRAAPGVDELRKSFPKDVHFVYRNLPLPMHQNARIAAQAAMAAFLQGKFWEMHDVLFEHQRELGQEQLFGYAKQIGLDMGKFEKDFASQKVADLIARDMKDAGPAGVSGTPTFYIDGHQQIGAMSPEQWKGLVAAEIAKADKLLAGGVKPADLYSKMVEEQLKGNEPAPVKIEVGASPAVGAKNAPLTIVEWSDFQCPYCGKMFPVLKQVEDEYKGKVRIVFKNEPLPFHQNARPAAEAALAAGAQGKFWEMHDLLFTHQTQLDRASLEGYAQQIGLNLAKFKADLDSNAYEKAISEDSAQGLALGANGTPTFFINGRQVVGFMPFEQFKGILDEELGKIVAKK